MAGRDIVVVGASAGGVQALVALVGGLPADFPAALLVVLHVPPYAESRLPEILARAGVLPVAHAVDGERICAGRVYVAPPDHHLVVRPGRVELSRGPRENRSRPAVDPLFRTAARAYGDRVVGVILTGALYDGSAGLLAVKSGGGLAVVQDPEEAAVDSMPRSALRLTAADHVAPAAAIGALLNEVVREPIPRRTTDRDERDDVADSDERMTGVIARTIDAQAAGVRAEQATIYTCPDCGGTLFQEDAPVTRFRCHVGHAYAPEVLLHLKAEEIEAALWVCVRMLTEKAALSRQVANRMWALGAPLASVRAEEEERPEERHARVLRDLLESMPGPGTAVESVVNGAGR